jgi:hypothetical protein
MHIASSYTLHGKQYCARAIVNSWLISQQHFHAIHMSDAASDECTGAAASHQSVPSSMREHLINLLASASLMPGSMACSTRRSATCSIKQNP